MTTIQQIMFMKHKYSTNEAREWLRLNGYNRIKRVKKTKMLLKYVLQEPRLFKNFNTKVDNNNGMIFVYGLV